MAGMQIEERIGRRLNRAREEKGWTQEHLGENLARYLGKAWSKQTVSAAEAGGRDFKAVELLFLAVVFDKRIGWFFEADIDAVEAIDLPSGMTLSEPAVIKACGTPLDKARNLAEQLHQVASEVASIDPEAGR
jgi:transcriptional regulator with XRE-family HTH domain